MTIGFLIVGTLSSKIDGQPRYRAADIWNHTIMAVCQQTEERSVLCVLRGGVDFIDGRKRVSGFLAAFRVWGIKASE